MGSELAFIQGYSEIHSLHVAISSSRTSGQLHSFPPRKTLALLLEIMTTDISLSLGLYSTPDLCLWLRLLRILCSDSIKLRSEAVLAYTALSLKKISLAFLLFGVSHISILSFQFNCWPISIVGSPTVLKGVTCRSWRTRYQHLNNAVFPSVSIGELSGSPVLALIFLIT